jgi:hypothetical protein
MSVVWNDEYSPDDIGDGYQVETELDWIMQDDRNANAFDAADAWLAAQDVPDWLDQCNTCGGSGRWETTFEDDPTTLVDIGPCPECQS